MSPRWLTLATLLPVVSAYAASPEDRGVVEGFVFEGGTGEALVGVSVSVGERTVKTDRDGRFVVELPTGTYPVTVQHQGVTRPTQTVDVVLGGVTELLVTWTETADRLPAQAEVPSAKEAVVDETYEGALGMIAGIIVSEEDNRPIEGARIYVRGSRTEGRTDATGRYTLELPPGQWELSILAPSYATQRLQDISVQADKATALDLKLVPAGFAMDDFFIRAPKVTGGATALMDERKESTSVADMLGAEQIARTGDSTAAGALSRVTGLTLVGGRYIYVRGLGERYSSTLMDGGPLPSPEPERRVVPLDLFPAAILDSVVVQKTFSPDMPAEFGGGTIQLRTRTFPTEPVVNLSVGGGYLTGTTFKPGWTYEGGKTDWLGIDGGTRALPAEVREASEQERLEEGDRFSDAGYSPEELAGFGAAMPNIWTPEQQMILPDLSVSGTFGGGFRLGQSERKAGVLLGLTYDQRWNTDEYPLRFYGVGTDGLVERTKYDYQETVRSVRLGGMLAMGIEPGENQTVESTTLVLRYTDDETRLYEGLNNEVNTNVRVSRLRWVERMLISQQLRGEHQLSASGIQLDWRGSFATATRLEPDRREVRYDERVDGVFRLSDRPEGNQRFFSDSVDNTWSGAMDLTIPVEGPTWSANVKTGFLGMRKDRTVDSRRYKYLNKGPISGDPDVKALPPEQIFAPENLGSEGFQFEEITQRTDNYSADQTLLAGYVMMDITPFQWLTLMGGARVEWSQQNVSTFELFNPNGETIDAKLDNVDALPAATATFRLPLEMQVRLGYGRTVNRPEFRELSPAVYRDVMGSMQTFGNPELQRALIDNVDLRWEWFPNPGDVVSVSGFYKYFTNPIERAIVIGAEPTITYQNAKSAYNLGVELEIRKNFEFIAPALRDVYVGANLSLIQSRVALDADSGVQTSDERALQGQSPWVINAQLGYDNPELGLNAAILYNGVGPRIIEVGALGMPDSYSSAFHGLDVVFNTRIYKGLGIQLAARNLLDVNIAETIGDQTIKTLRDGRRFTIKLNWRL